MKHRKIRGCQIKGNTERGAWAELYFMVLAMSYGLKVSSPYGGFGPYDVGVENVTGPILRVQVKCTMCKHPKGGYSLSIRGPKYRGYPKGSVDFFALYIIPTDDWYIIPYKVIGKRYATLHFSPDSARQKYGKYLEAWHLLLHAAHRPGHGPIDLHASCDAAGRIEASEATEINPAAKSIRSVRKIFRTMFQS
jgi:hypothetical protein